MIEYNVKDVADELMFTPSELQEILEIYFEEAIHLVPECHQALESHDYVKFSQIMHGFKGASSNLRMHSLANMAEELEKLAKTAGGEELTHALAKELPGLQGEIETIKASVDAFYGGL